MLMRFWLYIVDVTVNSTVDPIVFYCGVPGHCPKGMFGFVNPPNAAGAVTTVAQMMPAMIANVCILSRSAQLGELCTDKLPHVLELRLRHPSDVHR